MWEHMVVQVDGTRKIDEKREGYMITDETVEEVMKKVLDKASLDGWELVSVVGKIIEGSYASHTDGFCLFFKRPKT